MNQTPELENNTGITPKNYRFFKKIKMLQDAYKYQDTDMGDAISIYKEHEKLLEDALSQQRREIVGELTEKCLFDGVEMVVRLEDIKKLIIKE